jgi:P27 family predicted phage terminase small subunit
MGRHAEDPKEVKARGGRTNAGQKKSLTLPASFPMMPPGMSKPQKKYWNYYSELFLSANLLNTIDAQILLTLCDESASRDSWYKIRDDDLALGESPMYQVPNGTWTVKPYVNAITKIHADLKVSYSKLGLDPKARINLKPVEATKKTKTRTSMKK